jgi:hypothetical protein
VEPFAATPPQEQPLIVFDVPGIGLSPAPRRPHRMCETTIYAGKMREDPSLVGVPKRNQPTRSAVSTAGAARLDEP